MCGSSGRLNAHDPCSNGPPLGVIISLNVSKVGSSMAMKKAESRICPSKPVTGESACVHTLHTALLCTPGLRTAGVCRVLAAPRPLHGQPETLLSWGRRGGPGDLPASSQQALIRAVERAYLNLNLSFKIEREKITLSFCPFAEEFQ